MWGLAAVTGGACDDSIGVGRPAVPGLGSWPLRLAGRAMRHDQLEGFVLRNLDRGRSGRVEIVTANLDIHQQCAESIMAAKLVDGADIVVGDGMPLVWGRSRLAGRPLPGANHRLSLIWTLSRKAGQHGRLHLSAQGAAWQYPAGRRADKKEVPWSSHRGLRTALRMVSTAKTIWSTACLTAFRTLDRTSCTSGSTFPSQDRLIERIPVVVPGC